jgi:uncharacterized repeat protein (TIGR01451 family)
MTARAFRQSAKAVLLFAVALGAWTAEAAPAVSKEFLDPATVNVGNLQTTTGQTANNTPAQGDVRTVRLGISQVGNAITAGAITDSLPAQIRLANPVNARASADCGATPSFSGAAGGGTFVASNLEVPAGTNANPGRCFVYFDVTSTQVGNWINEIAVGGFTGTEAGIGAVSNAQAAPRNLTVTALGALQVNKTFAASPIFMGASTQIQIQITNPNAGRTVDVTQVAENLPSNIAAANTTPTVSCTAGGTAGTAAASGTSGNVTIALTGTTIAGGGSCTLTWTVAGVVQNGTDIAGTNTIPANGVTNSRGLGSNADTASITVQSPVAITKSFSPNPARANEPVTVTINVQNRSAAAITNVGFTDNPISSPAGLAISAVAALNATNCGAGAATSNTTTSLTFSGGAIPANTTCTITATVSGGGPQDYTNTTSGASWAQGGNSAVTDPATAGVSVFSGFRGFKSFLDPRTGVAINGGVSPGDVVRFRIELENFSDGQITGVSVTDNLPLAGAAQIVYATGATAGARNPQTNCTTSANPRTPGAVGAPTTAQTDGAASVTFTGLVIPGNPDGNAGAGTRCFVEFDAAIPRTWPAGTQISNQILPANVGGGTLQNNVVANIATASQLQIFKAFSPTTISAGDSSLLTITLVNNGFYDLNAVSVTDALPAGAAGGQLRVATPASTSTTCGGTPAFNIAANRQSLTVSGLTVPARPAGAQDNRCVVTFRVTGGVPTTYPNTIPTGNVAATDSRTNTAVSPAAPANATLTATPSLTASKSFAPSPVAATGGVSRVTVTLNNIGSAQLTGVGFNDPLPASLRVASPPNATTTCPGGTVTATAAAATAALAGATIPAGTSCTVQFNVVTNGAPNPVANSIPPGGVFADNDVVTTTATAANLATFSGGTVDVQKSFTPTDLQSLGQPTRLQITLSNVSVQALTGVSITDNLPTGMVVTANPNPTTTCGGGLVEAAPGSNLVRLTGGTIAAGNGSFPAPPAATCVIAVDVTLRRNGTAANTIPAGAVTTDQALTNASQAVANATALATVGVTKRFEPSSVPPNTPSRLIISIINSAGTTFNNLQVVDPLPAGLTIASPSGASTTCGAGAVSTRPSTLGGGRIDVVLTGGTLAGSLTDATTCEVAINVIAAANGSYANSVPTGGVTADGGITNNGPANATLQVRAAATIAKSFANPSRRINEANRLTIAITNPNAIALTNVTLTDDYPASVFNTTTPNATTTCSGGVATANPSATFVRLTNATVPANSSCTIAVDVLANVEGSWTNTISDGALSSAEGVSNLTPVSASFVTLEPPSLGKEFIPVQIGAGGTSRLRIVLGNINSSALTLSAALTDTLPAGLTLGATPIATAGAFPDPQGLPRCAGTVTAAAGGTTVTYANGSSIPAGGCVIIVNVTGSAAGQFTNSIAAGGLQTNAGPNPLPATSTLAISTLNSVSGRVYRDDDNDGVVDAVDPGFAGQTVQLLDANGVVIATTITDSLGNYAFLELPNGTYSVRQPNQPSGTFNGTTSVGTGAGTAGTATAPGTTPSVLSGIVLAGGQNAVNYNFGEIVPSSLSGSVFLDNNNSGTRQSNDPPLPNTTITLTGTNDLGQAVSVTTTTDANGQYRFDGLRPGTYAITEPAQPPNSANGMTTAGTINGATAGTATGVGTTPSAISGIVLGPNRSGENYNFAEVPSVTISGTVYVDRDRNNEFNPSDAGRIPGVTIRLVQGADCTSGTTLATTTTNASGNYSFSGVAAGGNYLICQTQPNGYGNGNANGVPGANVIAITNLPATGLGGNNFGEIGGSIAGGVYLDANNDGTRQGGEAGIPGVLMTLTGTDVNGNAVTRTATTDASGNYTFFDLPAAGAGGYTVTEQAAQPNAPGTSTPTLNGRTTAGTIGGTASGTATPVTTTPSAVAGIVLGAGADSINNNFGEILPVSVSGTVFFDSNGNGTQQAPGEAGIPNSPLVITGTNDLGQPVTRNIQTDANGNFNVTDLRPGTYAITQPAQPPGTSNGATAAGPAGGTATPVGTVPSAIGNINLTTPGASAPNNLFAELPTGSAISGRVWRDPNNNGVVDPGETGIEAVTIELTGTTLSGQTVNLTTTTAADGTYNFAGLAPGTYTVREPTQPAGTVNGQTVVGNTGGTPSAVATTPSTITSIPLGVNQVSTNNNFGELPAATISGSVYNDVNNNGVRDPGEGGFAGQTITLTGTNDLGQPVSVTFTTGADGTYSFPGLRPGAYTLTQPNQPANSVPGQTTPGTINGTPTGTGSPVGTAPSTITNVVIGIGQTAINNNFGEIGNSADVTASKQPIGTFATGNEATYRITVANIGQVSTSGAYTVRDRLPAGMTLVAAAGTGWACDGAVGATLVSCTSSAVIAAGAANANAVDVRVRIATSATGGATQIVLNNALLVEGGGELPAYAPTPQDRTNFDANPGALPVCNAAPAVNQNVCRAPTTVLLSASVSGTVWFDSGTSRRQLDPGDRRLPGWVVEVIDADAPGAPVVRRITTNPDGSWRADDLIPGRNYQVRFRDPQSNVVFGLPVSGEQGSAPIPCLTSNPGNASRSSCVQSGAATQLAIVLQPGDNLVQQSLPLDPGGVVYDAVTRDPVPGSVVTLTPEGSCPGWNPSTAIANATLGGYAISGASISMTVGNTGAYQFTFTQQAPASCQFRLTVTPPPSHSFISQIIPPNSAALAPPPAPGSIDVQTQPGAPPQGSPTGYHLIIGGGSGQGAILHNHIPLDPRALIGISIIKIGSVREIELGDSMSYAIRVRNSTAAARPSLFIEDRLPAGFRYIPGTARVERNGVVTTIPDPAGGVGPNLTFDVGALAGNAELTLSYRVRVGVGATQGDGINRARARPPTTASCVSSPGECSNESRWQVRVNAGVFTTDACVVGKVFVDCNNNNHVQDPEELGIPGVRMYLQDGTFFITDSEGKYSYCGLPPKTHVLKVDPTTLPRGSRLTTSSNRNAGDANSLFLDLKNGELHRADFIEGSCSNTVLEQVKARRTQGEVGAPQTEKKGGQPLRFKGKTPGYPQQGTDGANQQPAVKPRPDDGKNRPKETKQENDTPTWQLPMNQPSQQGGANAPR